MSRDDKVFINLLREDVEALRQGYRLLSDRFAETQKRLQDLEGRYDRLESQVRTIHR